MDSLEAAHVVAHEKLDLLFFRCLETLVALDVGPAGDHPRSGARRAWQLLSDAVTTHANAEETAFDGVLTDAAEPPRGASPRIFHPEHRQLETLLQRGHDVLAELAALAVVASASALRAAIVRHLEPLMRVQHLLSHHFERERTLIYPFVIQHLDAARHATLTETLQATTTLVDAALAAHSAPA